MNRYDFPSRCPNCNGGIEAELCDFGGDYVLYADAEEYIKSERVRIVRGDFGQICSYCGEEMAKPSQWEKLQDHIRNCEKHPLKIMKDKLWHMEAEINSLKAVGCVNCLELRKALEIVCSQRYHYEDVYSIAFAALSKEHDWQCGCGHWNGSVLAICAQCGRKSGEM